MKNQLPAIDRLCTVEVHGANKLRSNWFKMLADSTVNLQEILIGVDEVGRGSVFGPMVVAACANLTGWHLKAIRDSKLVKSPEERKQLAAEIRHNCIWSSVVIHAEAINQYGTTNCLLYAGKRAKDEILRRLMEIRPESRFTVIFDGHEHTSAIEGNCRIESIEKADATIFEVSCASILAKAIHDQLIEKFCQNQKYARYGLSSHRGYGTPKHSAALKEFGPSDQHRINATRTLMTEPNDATCEPAKRRNSPNHTDGQRIFHRSNHFNNGNGH